MNELMCEEVASNLIWRHLFGVEQRRECLVAMRDPCLGPCEFEAMTDLAFARQRTDVEPARQFDGASDITELRRYRDAVDGDIGRAAGGPDVVRVGPQLRGKSIGVT